MTKVRFFLFFLIFQHSMDLYNCIPPSLGNYGLPICENGTSTTEPIGLPAFMEEIDQLIDCARPCRMFKMRTRTFKYESLYAGYDTLIEMKFPELITITNDQYSYSWLNLLAEVGGYVGLFLGFSVFQVIDLMDHLLQRKWLDVLKEVKNKICCK